MSFLPSFSGFMMFMIILAIIAYNLPSTLASYFKLRNSRYIVLVNFFSFTGICYLIAWIMFFYGMSKQYTEKANPEVK